MTTTTKCNGQCRTDGGQWTPADMVFHLCARHGHDWLAIQGLSLDRLIRIYLAEHDEAGIR